MAYPFSDFPPLADLSLNDSRRPPARRTTLLRLSNPSQHTLTFPTYQMQRRDLSWSGRHHSRWSVPGWQSTLDFGSDSVPPLHSSTFEPWGASMPKSTMESLFLPRMSLPDLDLAPSPSDTSSSIYSDLSPSPPPSLHVVCDLPVVAPRPLPYHSPTFLQFDLPDVDEDLSHPPYTRGSTTRKRKATDDLEIPIPTKRHAAAPVHRSPRSYSARQLAVHGIETRISRRQRSR